MLNQRQVSPTCQALWLNAEGCVFAGRLCLVFPPRPCHAGPWEGLKAAPSLTWLPFSPQTPFSGRVPPPTSSCLGEASA